MPSNLRLSRETLARLFGKDAYVIRAFEEMQQQTTTMLPDAVAIIEVLANTAQVLATDARDAANEAQKYAQDVQAMLATIEDQSRRLSDLEGYLAAVQIAAEEQAAMSFDDFANAEFLADQVSAGAVLTFTFTQPQQQIWVELTSATATNTARARTDGVNPTSTVGAILHPGAPVPLLDTTGEVRVLATAGDTVTVYGYSR